MATHSSILAWEMPRTEEPDGPHSMGPIRVGLNPATTNRSISKDHTRVCVCVCVCRSVCLSVCLPVVRLLSQEGRVLGGRRGDKGGASVGQRGGAEALRSTAPPWLPVGLGSGQVPGKLGAQDSLRLGPQEVQRPPGRGGREAAGPEDRHLRGRAALSGERDGGEAPLSQRGRVWSGRGWEGAETSAPLSPPPRPRAHARTPSRSLGGPGSPSGPRARPGGCWSGVGGVRGPGRRQQAGVRSRVVRLKYSTAPRGEGRPVGPTCRSERKGGEAQGS